MTGFLGRIFGALKKEDRPKTPVHFVEDVLASIVQFGGFELDFRTSTDEQTGEIIVEFSGNDEEMLRARDGQLLDALQLFVKRAVQHQLTDEKLDVRLDVGGFREETNQALIELADKLREIAISRRKTVYFRALPPKDRKVIHQYLADDTRVKSRSIGEGHYKKIKIYPVRSAAEVENEPAENH